ncbi:hypothetical protein, partial [Salmonella sp. s51228]|uniref:hypothetical protein n=1 Tax=Salmonella sp. s51228 TaxID=3159652 RepID=UPI00397FD394
YTDSYQPRRTGRVVADRKIFDGVITDPDVVIYSEKINVTDLQKLAVVGFGLSLTLYQNIEHDYPKSSNRITQVFHHWKMMAPVEANSFKGNSVPFTYSGLFEALKRSNLLGYSHDLGLR